MSSRSSINESILNNRKGPLEILSSVGVKLPVSTKPHVDALQERLTKALDRSQRHAELLPHRRPNVGSLEPWITDSGGTLKEAMISYNLQEMVGGGNIGSFNELRIAGSFWNIACPPGELHSKLIHHPYALGKPSLNPRSQIDIRSLSKDIRCIICDNTSRSRCSALNSSPFLSAEKIVNAQTGRVTNHLVLFSIRERGYGLKYTTDNIQSLFNHNVTNSRRHLGERTNRLRKRLIPRQIQLAVIGGNSMLVYDRKRLFTDQIYLSQDPECSGRLENVVKTGYQGMKFYLWAKYIGNHNLNICLDRISDQSTYLW
ncbi:hypothetical protein ACEPAF_2158 [Sanghuangporus sanghuang]